VYNYSKKRVKVEVSNNKEAIPLAVKRVKSKQKVNLKFIILGLFITIKRVIKEKETYKSDS
jgi:hypothetical protein